MTTLTKQFTQPAGSRWTAFTLAMFLLLFGGSAQAAEFVIPNGDIVALKTAIIAANSNNQEDTIRLAANGTYPLTTVDNTTYGPTGLPMITSDNGHRLTIIGNGATITRSSAAGTPPLRLLYLFRATVDIIGLTLTRGGADDSDDFVPSLDGGSICNDQGTLSLTSCTLTGNKAPGNGGAIFSGNRDPEAAADSVRNASLTLTNCTISDNESDGGGAGIANLAWRAFAELTVINCTLERNSAERAGGGIANFAFYYPDSRVNLVVRHCTFRDNDTYYTGQERDDDGFGGGVANFGHASANLTDCLFAGNVSTSRVQVAHDAHVGGAIANEGLSLTVERCTFISNASEGNGGAISSTRPNVIVRNSTFSDNRAGEVGGAIYNGQSLDPVTEVVISGSMTVVNCTFSGNASSVEIGNNIFYAVAEISDNRGNVSLGNNIFNNTAPGSNQGGAQGSVTSRGYNLSNDGGNGFLNQPTDIINTNPLLGPLQNNGGLTPTMALLPGSPALDRIPSGVDFPATDQRGIARPQGSAADIGAYEAVNTPPAIQAASGVTRQQGSPAANQVIATVNDQQTAPGELLVSVASLPPGITLTSLTNSGGQIRASLAASCTATPGAKSISLEVRDSGGATATATLTVTVTANTPPALAYAAQSVVVGTTQAFNPSSGPTDNGQIASISLQSVTPSTGLALTVGSSTGHVTITSATLSGAYTVVIRATDNCGAAANASFTVTALCPAISLTPASLPAAAVNTAYNQSLSASPAGTTYSFAVSSGLLPVGLTLNSNGSFNGVPTQSGNFNFRVRASGWGGCSGFRDYTLSVSCVSITVNPATLANGEIGAAYSQTISATPAGAYSFSLTSGALPPGLTLNAATGALTGFPTAGGTFNFRVTALAGSCTGWRDYALIIGCPAITLPALANATPGASYTGSVAASPAGSYSYSVTTGSLPTGLTLNSSTGALSGTPTVTGTYNFTAKAQTANGCSGTRGYSLVVACTAITLTALPTPALNTAYNQTIGVSPAGGYSFAVTSGALPAGLTLNMATGAITGTAAAAGSFNFTIRATGAGGCAGTRSYSFTLSGGCPAITLPSLPNSAVGQMYSQSVAASPSGAYIYSLSAGSLPPGVTLYSSGMLFGFPAAAGTYNFTITAIGANACTGSRAYTVTIQ